MISITKRRLLFVLGGAGLGGYLTYGDSFFDQTGQQEDEQFPFEGNLIELTGEGDFVDTIDIENRGASILTFEYSGEAEHEIVVFDSSQRVVESIDGEGPSRHQLMLQTNNEEHELRVRTESGSWELTIADHIDYTRDDSNVRTPPIEYSGEDTEYIGPILFDVESETEFEITFEESTGVQSITLFDPTGWSAGEVDTFDLSEMDSSTGIVSKFVNGVGFIGVEATGGWELEMDESAITTSGTV